MTDLFKTPQDFGACGDGVTDDRAAFQCAIDSGWPVSVPWTPAGYAISSRLTLPSGATVEFSKKPTQIKLLTPGEWLFEVAGSDVYLSGVRSDLSSLTSGGGFLLRSDLARLERVTIENCLLIGATGVVHDRPHASNIIVSLTLKNIASHRTRGHGISLQRSFAYQHVEKCSVLYTGSTSTNFKAFSSFNNEGAFWSQCDATNGQVDGTNGGNHGFYFENCRANWIDRCMADMVGGGGFVLNGGNEYFYLDQCVSSMVGTHGYSIVSSDKITLQGCNAGGRAGMPYAPSMPGIYAYNSADLIIDDGCRSYAATGLPVQIVSCARGRNNAYVL